MEQQQKFEEERDIKVYGGLFARQLLRVDRENRSASVLWTPSSDCANPFGMVQGGLIATILDETAVLAGHLLTDKQFLFPSLSFNVEFFAPVPCEPIEAIGRLNKQGRSSAFLEAVIYGSKDDDRNARETLARMSLVSKPFKLDRT